MQKVATRIFIYASLVFGIVDRAIEKLGKSIQELTKLNYENIILLAEV